VTQSEAYHQGEPAKIVVAIHLTRRMGLIVGRSSVNVAHVDQVYDGEVERQVELGEHRLQ
jgi:hypothetical protein